MNCAPSFGARGVSRGGSPDRTSPALIARQKHARERHARSSLLLFAVPFVNCDIKVLALCVHALAIKQQVLHRLRISSRTELTANSESAPKSTSGQAIDNALKIKFIGKVSSGRFIQAHRVGVSEVELAR